MLKPNGRESFFQTVTSRVSNLNFGRKKNLVDGTEDLEEQNLYKRHRLLDYFEILFYNNFFYNFV